MCLISSTSSAMRGKGDRGKVSIVGVWQEVAGGQ